MQTGAGRHPASYFPALWGQRTPDPAGVEGAHPDLCIQSILNSPGPRGRRSCVAAPEQSSGDVGCQPAGGLCSEAQGCEAMVYNPRAAWRSLGSF